MVVQAITKLQINAWHLELVINQIIDEISQFEDFKISHIKRAGNAEAIFLSKWAISLNDDNLRIRHINSLKNLNLSLEEDLFLMNLKKHGDRTSLNAS